jgi:hypothetical protein
MGLGLVRIFGKGRKPAGPSRKFYWPIELATAEKTLLAFPPINRRVPTTITKMTASITAYSAISWPSSSDHNLERPCIITCSNFRD